MKSNPPALRCDPRRQPTLICHQLCNWPSPRRDRGKCLRTPQHNGKSDRLIHISYPARHSWPRSATKLPSRRRKDRDLNYRESIPRLHARTKGYRCPFNQPTRTLTHTMRPMDTILIIIIITGGRAHSKCRRRVLRSFPRRARDPKQRPPVRPRERQCIEASASVIR